MRCTEHSCNSRCQLNGTGVPRYYTYSEDDSIAIPCECAAAGLLHAVEQFACTWKHVPGMVLNISKVSPKQPPELASEQQRCNCIYSY
jgi:hypothetical protein